MAGYMLAKILGGGGGGTVTDVTASAPLVSSGGVTPNISIGAYPDNTELVLGTTYPFGFQSSTGGVNGSARFTIPDGKILVISKQSDIGIDYIDVPVAFSGPTIFIAGEGGLTNEGLILGSGTTPFGDPHFFQLQTLGGDNLDGTPENANGTSLGLQASDAGSLGGIPGEIDINSGSAKFGDVSGAWIRLTAGQGNGLGDAGTVSLERVGGFSGNLTFAGGNAPGLSQTQQARIYADNTGALFISSNGGAYTPFAGGGGGDLVSATLATASNATASTINNSAGVTFNIPASGVDSGNHKWAFGTAGNQQFQVQGTFDGVGGLASGLLVFGTPGAPSEFNWIGGDALTPATNALDWIYQGGTGGHNNPGFDGGRGSNFQATSGNGGDGLDNSHQAGAAGSIIFAGGTGGTGSGSFTGGVGGTVSLQAGPGGPDGGSGVGTYGDIVLTANQANITVIGSNGTIVTTVAANESNAWDIRDTSGGNPSYIQVNTNTGAQSIDFGNASNNPSYNFIGNGLVDINSGLHVGGSFAVQGPTTTHGSVDMQLGPFLWTVERVANLLAGNDNLQTNTFTIPDLGADSSATYAGIENDIATNVLNHNLTGEIIGNNTQILVQQGLNTVNAVTGYGSVIAIANAGTITQANGFTSFLSDAGAGTVITFDQFLAKNPGNPTGGTVTGLHVENLTNGTINYGIVIDGATDKAIWVKAGNSTFEDDANFNGGIFVKQGVDLIGATSGDIALQAATVTTPYSIIFPAAQGAASTTLVNDGIGNLSWASTAFTGALGNNLYTEVYSATAPAAGINNMNDFDMTFTNPGAPITATINGLIVKESFGAAWVSGGGTFVGILSNVVSSLAGGNTTTSMTGFRASMQSSGLSNITTVRGYESSGSFTHAGNVVTDYESYHVSDPTTSGTITNVYGLHIDSLTAGTNNYGFVIEGATTKAIWSKSGIVEFDNPTTATSGTVQSSLFSTTISPAGDSTATYEGQEVVINQSTQHNISNPIIGQINVINSHPGGGNTDFKTTGFRSANQLTGAGTVTTAYGFDSLISANTGAIGDAANYHAQNLALASGGTATNQYGVLIDSLSGATNNYGIKILGADTYSLWIASGLTRLDGGVLHNLVESSANYVVLASDYLVGITDTTVPRTVTLPAAISANIGQVYTIKDESGGAGTNNITVGTGGGNIDGVSTIVMSADYAVLRVYSNGSNWFTT